MIAITHYEVYTDKGDGWQLIDRFAAEQRQEAFNLAKESERGRLRVKIIKEVFDVSDNTYQESVEYVSNLSKGNRKGVADSAVAAMSSPPQKKTAAGKTPKRDNVFTALIKLIGLTIICLVLANLLVGLIFPVIEGFIPEENNKPILFTIFFVFFLSIAVPLILKQVPWHVFTAPVRVSERPVSEKKFYDRAEDLVRLYNLNEDVYPVVAPAYPEANLEYKRYIVSFLSELLTQIDSPSTLQNNFSRFGIKLLTYGGCLELARYSGLGIGEANSMLYEAFKIIDGSQPDLEAFYEAKHSYRDNKIAIFLTGVGAFMMDRVITRKPLPTDLLNLTFSKWEKQNLSPLEDGKTPEPEPLATDEIVKSVMVSIKSDLKFLDSAIPGQEDIAARTSSEIHNIIFNLLGKYRGTDTLEAGGITTIKFAKLNLAVRFALECLKDIGTYQEEVNDENLILRNCALITEDNPEIEPNLSSYLADLFEHVYNAEIVMTAPIAEALEKTDYKLDFLGEKKLAGLDQTAPLYKLLDEK